MTSSECYAVTVCNGRTGETVVLQVYSTGIEQAKVDALYRTFHERGWRKATAVKVSTDG